MKYTHILQQLNLSKNESEVYETLLLQGELPASLIARESGVNRRNVYDTLNRLVEKGLVFEVRDRRESRYQSVSPHKLREILSEKQTLLEEIMPDLESMYSEVAHGNEVYIYKGVEGWKSYMRDFLRSGDVLYTIGGKGQWMDEKLKPFLTDFVKKAKKSGASFKTLFDYEVLSEKRGILDSGLELENSRFLPQHLSTKSTLEIFGDQVVILDGSQGIEINNQTSYFVIKNPEVAASFKIWFEALWKISKTRD